MTPVLPENKQKLIIMVDELDRCRPTYAVEILEKINHFFNAKGVVFILGIDERQIANAMASVYGPKLDTDGYLRRFFDWRFKLPIPSSYQFNQFLSLQFDIENLPNIWQKNFGIESNSIYYRHADFLKAISGVSDALSLSLRQQEQNFTEINFYLRTLQSGYTSLAYPLGTLVPLRSMNPELFEKAFKRHQSRPLEVPEIRQLFDYLKQHLTNFNGQPKLGWDHWYRFEGSFIAWFISEDMIAACHDNSSKFAAKLNKAKQLNQVPVHIDEIEYEYNMWSHCYTESMYIHECNLILPNTTIAEFIKSGFDNAGKYIA